MTVRPPPGRPAPGRLALGRLAWGGRGSRPGGALARGGWVVADQAISSLTNFALAVVVLRSVGARQFGAFTVALAVYYIGLGVGRAVGGEPHVVRCSDAAEADARSAARQLAGAATLIGAVQGAVVLIASVAIGGLVGAALLPLAFCLPGLLLQDGWRYAFFASGSPRKAFVNDAVWGGAQIVLLLVCVLGGWRDVGALVLAWGVAATLASLFGAVQAGVTPDPRQVLTWARAARGLRARLLAEFALSRVAGQLVLLLVGWSAGLAALGTLQAAPVVLGPYRVIALGATGFGVPEGVRLLRRSREALGRLVLAISLCLGLTALVFGGAAFVLPQSLYRALLGSTWDGARRVLPWATLWTAALGIIEGARVGLLVHDAAGRALKAQAFTAPLVLVGGGIGAALGGAPGAAGGLALACSIGAIAWWRSFLGVNRASPAGAPPTPRLPIVTAPLAP